ncbi:MAG: MFS transporter [Chloroflexota bacterium]
MERQTGEPLTMTTLITDVDKIRRMPWLVAGDFLNTGFYLLTFSGSVFILFLSELNLNASQIGFLLSLIPFAGLIAPFVAAWIARFGYKRTFVIFWSLRKFVFALMLLTPLVVAEFGYQRAFAWVSLIIFAFSLCRAVAETGGYPWRKEAIPPAIRGKFVAVNNMSTTIAGILVAAGASAVIDAGSGLGRFMFLMTIGISLGLISIYAYTRVPGGAPLPDTDQDGDHLQEMRQALSDHNFFYFLFTLGLATLGGASVISFVPLFMKDQVGLSEGNIVLLNIGTYLGALLTSYWWGWITDRYGSQPVMQLSLYLMLALPLAWFVMPKYSPSSLPAALLISFLAGVATLAWQISWVRYLYVNAVPPHKESPYMAVYYAWFSFTSGLGPLLAGFVVNLSRNLRTDLGLFRLDPYTPLFGLSLLLLLAGLATVSQLSSLDAVPFRRLAGMFLRGNPVRALESLVQYNFSVTELSRVAITERMGDARSPLSTQELIETLTDPSFNVRYEAIHAIGRMPPEPELIDALLALLDQPPSELSFVVTRSLGRLGDPKAIPPLRRLLCSGYHLVEANSARALAMLGDVDSVPVILKKFRTETNAVLRIAYVSALGTLRVTAAVGELFDLLRATQTEVQRGEIGLALARIAGEEDYYMQHWRLMRANPQTATAQAVLALQKLGKHPDSGAWTGLIDDCAQDFARGNSAAGTARLRELLGRLSEQRLDDRLAHMLPECDRSLALFDDTRLELILLALHTLQLALRQLAAPAAAAANVSAVQLEVGLRE